MAGIRLVVSERAPSSHAWESCCCHSHLKCHIVLSGTIRGQHRIAVLCSMEVGEWHRCTWVQGHDAAAAQPCTAVAAPLVWQASSKRQNPAAIQLLRLQAHLDLIG